jgi:hypothetical protein
VALLLALTGREPLIVDDLVMLEVLQGARDEVHAAPIERDLRRCVLQPILTEEITVQAVRNYRTMRTSGITVRKTIDLIIGTFYIQRGHQLLHDDRDFDPMERLLGLSVVR